MVTGAMRVLWVKETGDKVRNGRAFTVSGRLMVTFDRHGGSLSSFRLLFDSA